MTCWSMQTPCTHRQPAIKTGRTVTRAQRDQVHLPACNNGYTVRQAQPDTQCTCLESLAEAKDCFASRDALAAGGLFEVLGKRAL